MPPLHTFLGHEHGCDVLRQARVRCGAAALERRGGRLHGAVGQNRRRKSPTAPET
jgi:hypothetical protein